MSMRLETPLVPPLPHPPSVPPWPALPAPGARPWLARRPPRARLSALVLVGLAALPAAGLLGCSGARSELGVRGQRPADTPRDAYALHRAMAVTMLRSAQPDRALPQARELVRMRPQGAEAHAMVGSCLLALHLYPEAEVELRLAVKLDGKLALARSALGTLLDRLGQHQEAEREHRAALEIEPQSALYHNNLGFSLYLKRRYREAVPAYREALTRAPTVARYHNNLAFAYAMEGNLRLAYEHFQRGGSPAEAENNMGFVYQRMGETARACAFYAKAVATDPGLRRARDNWTRTCKPDGDGSGNLSLAPAATPLSPGTSPAGLSSDSSADPASLSPSPRDASPNVAPPTPPPGTSPGVSPASISQGPSSGVTSPSQPLAGAARAKELRP